jgi:transcriptional regulator with XRE-family HTH domain
MPISGSTVVRRQLGRRLRRLREAASKTERDVETAKLLSRTKLWRIESGKTPVKVPDVRALCWLYGADAATTDALAALAMGTTEQGWWEDYGDAVPDWFGLYVGLETAVTEISTYDPELVHGLLQTEDYALAVYRAAQSDSREEFIRRQVRLRMERQQTLFRRTPPPRIRAVLGAGVLARQVGEPAVMAAQVRKLREIARGGEIEIRVLPWEVGAHAAMAGAFDVLEFDDADDPAVVYLESHLGARYLEKPTEVAECRRIFDVINKQAVPIEEYSS